MSTAAFEIAVDLVLLDDAIDVGVVRGAPATHPKYAGRRIFGAGINLTHLYYGKISLVEFMIERELGGVSKMYRGHSSATSTTADLEQRREKPWIAAVETFAIGGACQWLLVMDRVIAETGLVLQPARAQGGDHPRLRRTCGCPRFVGERTDEAGHLLQPRVQGRQPRGPDDRADEVVPGDGDGEQPSTGPPPSSRARARPACSPTARRCGSAHEPLDVFRRYMANYAREQAYCLYSPALIDNLERNWNANSRRL